MRLSAIGTKAAAEHRPDQLKKVTAELRQHAGQLPADGVVRLLFLVWAILVLRLRRSPFPPRPAAAAEARAA